MIGMLVSLLGSTARVCEGTLLPALQPLISRMACTLIDIVPECVADWQDCAGIWREGGAIICGFRAEYGARWQ